MHLIDKKDDIPRPLDLRQHIPQTLFKFAPVFCPRDHPGHIDADEPFPPQRLRHMAQGHPLGQPLHDGRLAHAGLTDQRRVVLVLPAKNLDDLTLLSRLTSLTISASRPMTVSIFSAFSSRFMPN